MELDRKAFHFDLDNKSVERFYTGKKNPWSDIKSWRTYEDMNEPEGEDYLQVIRDISPERIYD